MMDLERLQLATQKLSRLTGYLERDPNNLSLITDACHAASEAGLSQQVLDLTERYLTLAQLSPSLLNLRGLALLQQNDFSSAARIFEQLLLDAPSDPNLRFNLAWCKTMLDDHASALELLDSATTAVLSTAATLKVQALHRLGDLDAALELGQSLLKTYPEESGLLGALSLIAIDMQKTDLALEWATRGASTAEGLSTLGVLVLQENKADEALAYFDQGLSLRPDSARNLLGKGLALLASGDPLRAVEYIDRSAQLFEYHLGTWIASGWTHFVIGDRVKSRSIFEHALGIDDTFSECHGALAVLDILDGKIDDARRRTEVALRLDPRCFSGALAKSMLLEHDGDVEAAIRVRDITLHTPLDSEGRTIAGSLVSFASNRRGR